MVSMNFWFLIVIALILSYFLGLFDINSLVKATNNLGEFITSLSIKSEYLPDALYAVGETMVMAAFGTVVGAIIAYPIASLSVRDITPTWISIIARGIANILRTIPSIFWGILFVIMFGPGNKAGAVALAIYTAGYLCKFLYETFENVNKEYYESMHSLALPWLMLAKTLFKHTEKQIISHIMFMFEYNLRTASVLGIVGAGGIGYYITQYINILNYSAAFTFFIIIMLFVFIVDGISYIIRRRI